jgi:hypothetical protein
MPRIAILVVLTVCAVTLSACGGTLPVPSPQGGEVSAASATEIANCADLPGLLAGPSGDVTAEQAQFEERAAGAVSVIDNYGTEHADSYAGAWIDWSGPDVAVAFTRDVDLNGQIARKLVGPGIELRVQSAARSLARLQAIQETIGELDLGGMLSATAVDVVRDRVSVELNVVEPDTLALLSEAAPADALCVDGPSPAEIVPDTPQVRSGNGWRLLADAPSKGIPWELGTALDPSAYERLWAQLGLRGDPPAVDFDRELVLYFNHGTSGSCPKIRLDNVVVDSGVVYPLIVRPGVQPLACTSDAHPHAYLLAVERSRVPKRFRLQNVAGDCPGCGRLEVALPS